jgi:hypothetical protein
LVNLKGLPKGLRVSTVIGAKSASNFGKPERIAKEEKKPIKKAPYTGAFPLRSRIQV